MSGAQPNAPTARVRELLEAAWQHVGHRDGWSATISMPFPQRWDENSTPLIWYGYADRMVPGLNDGVEVAAAWASVVCDLSHPRPPQVIQESPGIQLLRVQGVRPLSSSEIHAFNRGTPIVQLLSTGQRNPELKAACQFWRECHGRFFDSVAARHPDFVAWLNQAGS
ncbi:MAG: hypothetical protein ACAI34_04145 [Verrucomicrobium sp.]|nr:hypothetical protein [Verrucomicrobium sp.]